MIPSDAERFAAVMGALAQAVDVEIMPERVAFLRSALEPYPIEAIEGAALRLAQERPYPGFPRLFEIVDVIESMDQRARAGAEDRATIEVERVLAAAWVAVCKRLNHLRAGGGRN